MLGFFFSLKMNPKSTFNQIRWRSMCSPDVTSYWPKSTRSISGDIIHPREISCWVCKSSSATPLLPCSCVEGTLPVALTYSPNLPLYLTYTNQHCTSISKRKQNKNQTHIYIQKYVFREEEKKINMETFQNFKSQCSVTKHIIPLIKLTYYTYEWYCLKTLELRLLKVQSQQGNLWGPGNYIYTHTL